MYLYASEKYMEELASYEKLEGYVAITYISSTGVRLRKWADFQADNVVKSVYVGDKVQVKGKVTRKNGESAYITDRRTLSYDRHSVFKRLYNGSRLIRK